MSSFLLDGMLGKLARWLRIAGFDTLYYRDKEDRELIKEALESNRVLLTRDRDLVLRAKKRGVRVLLINQEEAVSQLSQLKDIFDLTLEPSLSRCPICNGVLVEESKENVSDRVPESSLNGFEEFWACKECQKVYWKGSHWNKILETLEVF